MSLFKYILGGLGLLETGKVIKEIDDNIIYVIDRKTGNKCREKINPFLRYSLATLYQTKNGPKLSSKKIIDATEKYGIKYDDPKSAEKIPEFVKFFDIDMTQFTPSDISEYPHFNSFFYRKLKKNVRKSETNFVVCPADSRVMVFESISEATKIWIKGDHFSMEKLLGPVLCKQYKEASIAIFRLAPQDYHRFHSPVSGTVTSIGPLLGKEYYSVNPIAINSKTDVFGNNKRKILKIATKKYDQILYIPIGATLVGSINLTVKKGSPVSRIKEIGYFAFGGSSVICVFKKDKITFDSDLLQNSKTGFETLVKLGESLGT